MYDGVVGVLCSAPRAEHELAAACGEDMDVIVVQREVVDVMAERLTGVVLVTWLGGGARGRAAEEEHGIGEGW